MLRAGALNRRITIEQNTPTRSAAGAEVESWGTLVTVAAEVDPKRGREFFAAQAVQAEALTVFRIRHRSDVTRKMRVSYDGDLYDIVSVVPVGTREGLDIMATAQVND